MTATIGTFDRPTDLAPNSGVILARRPATLNAALSAERIGVRVGQEGPISPTVSSAQYRAGPASAKPRTPAAGGHNRQLDVYFPA